MASVLIIDAYGPFRRALRSALAAECPSIRLWEAGSGAEGMRLAVEKKPQIICMDIHIPAEDGLEVAAGLSFLCPQAPLIIISGSDLPEYRQAALHAGATHFVSKGAETSADILAVVKNFLQSLPPGT